MMRGRLLVSAFGAVVLLLTGCGASSDGLHSAVAAAKTTLSRTAVSELTLYNANVLGRARAKIFALGAFVFRTGLGYERIEFPAGKQREYLVYLPGKVYFERTSATVAVLYKGKEWASAALAGSGLVDAISPRFVEQAEGLNPELLLDEIVWGGESAKHLGEPVVDHVPESEYRVSVDLKRAMAAASGPSAGAMRAAIAEELTAVLSGRLGITVWVDGAGRVARFQAQLPGSGLGTVSMYLTEYGVKLATSLPPPSQVLGITAQTPSGASTLRSLWPFGG